MKVQTQGHRYELANFENKESEGQIIQFIEKIPAPKEEAKFEGQLLTLNDGTTNEEILEMLIDRMNYLQGKFPCRENAIAITKLDEALLWLNKRTSDRIKRDVEGKNIK
jgi:hypothetical protein